jgi:transposase
MTINRDMADRIRKLIADGMNTHAIAKRLMVSRGTVERRRDPHYTPKTTRKPRANVAKRRECVKKVALMRAGPETGYAAKHPTRAAIRKALPRQFRDVSLSTITSDLNALRLVSRVRAKVVNNDPAKNRYRLEFARAQLRNREAFKRIVFSDEAYVNNNDNTHRREFVRAARRGNPDTSKRAKTPTRAVKGRLRAVEAPSPRVHMRQTRVKVLIWGSIGYNFKGPLVMSTNSVKSETYQKDLLPVLLKAIKGKGKVLMQDNARPHTARTTMDFLEKRRVTLLKGWPPYSPHLNPIEKLWALIHRKVAELQPKTQEEIRTHVEKVWNDLDMSTINNLVAGYERGLLRTVDSNGRPW